MFYMYMYTICVFNWLFDISAQLPFQTLSASKSPNSTNNVPNKKRKVASPLEGLKDSKIIKYAKENSAKNTSEEKEEVEEKSDTDSECIELISDQGEKDLEQSSDDEKKMKIDTTPKRNSVTKNKTLEKSQKKFGALTKFLMKADSEPTSSSPKSKNESDYQNIYVHEENSEICSNLQSLESPLHVSCVSKEMDKVNVIENPNICQESDSDIAILSSDDEVPSELDKSRTSINEEKISTSATPATPKSDKDEKMKFKKLTPKQLEKRQETAKRKEEKAKLKMVCYIVKS